MIMLLVTLLSITGIAVFIVRVFRIPAFQAPFLSFCLVLIALYFAALAGQAELGSWLIFSLGLVGLVATLGQSALSRHSPPQIVGENVPPIGHKEVLRLDGVVNALQANVPLTVALATLLWLAIKWEPTYRTLDWDEFSHWAYATRLMAMEDSLWGETSPIMFPTYPPGAILNQYFFANAIGYHEWVGVVAQNLFACSAIAAAVGPAFRHAITGILAFSACVVGYWAFGFSMLNVYVDGLLAVVFAAGIGAILFAPRTWQSTIVVAGSACAMTLIKQIGMPLALILWSAFTAAQVIDLVAQRANTGRVLLARLGPASARSAIVLGSILALFTAWEVYKNHINAQASFATFGTPSQIAQFLLAPQGERAQAIWAALPQQLGLKDAFTLEYPLFSGVRLDLNLSIGEFWGWLAGLSLLTLAITAPTRRWATAAVLVVVGAGSVAYLALLLAAYQFSFSEWEARNYASFDRYFPTYLLAWFFALVGLIAYEILDRSRRWKVAFWITAAVFVCGAPTLLVRTLALPESRRPTQSIYEWARTYEQLTGLRDQTDALAAIIKQFGKPGDKVYYVSQAETGYTHYMFRFAVVPFPTNIGGFSLGKPYGADDIWTVDAPISNLLKGYQFLVVRKADAQLRALLAQYLREQDRQFVSGVFRIVDEGGSLRLDRIP